MAAMLSTLLTESWNFYKKNFRAVIVGAVFFGIVMALLQMLLLANMATQVPAFMETAGVDPAVMQQLEARMEAGDETAVIELQTLLQQQLTGQQEEEMGAFMRMFIKDALPVIAASIFLSFLVANAATAYYLLLTLDRKSPGETVKRVAKLYFPLLGVYLWMMIRSFIWIPIVGLIPAIILGPRFVLAPVILVKEKKGVMESVGLSYKRTSGYWGKIVGNILVAALCAWLVLFGIGIVLGIANAMVGIDDVVELQVTLQGILGQLSTAFLVVFVTKLSLSILESKKA